MILELLKHWGQPHGIGFLANYTLIGSGVKHQSIRTDLEDVRQGPEQDFHTFFRCQTGGNAYDRPVAEIMFNELEIDAFFLEYDDPRSGDFAPLRFLPKGKTVVLGLVTTKLGELESKDDIKRRIDEAAKFAPIEQLALSPQCGFASTVHGNDITTEQQAEKIRLVVEVAEEVWGSVPAMAD